MQILNEGDELAINGITIFSIDLNKDMTNSFYQKMKKSWVEQFPHNRIIIYDRDDEEVKECLDKEWVVRCLDNKIPQFACNYIRCNILSKHDKYLYMDLDVWVYDGSFIRDLNENTWFESYFNSYPCNCYCLAYSGVGHYVFKAQLNQMSSIGKAIESYNWFHLVQDNFLIIDTDNCFQRKGYIHFSFFLATGQTIKIHKEIYNPTVESWWDLLGTKPQHVYFTELCDTQYHHYTLEDKLISTMYKVDIDRQFPLMIEYFTMKNIPFEIV